MAFATSRKPQILFVAVLLGLYVLRLWWATASGLHADEAYYWVWSRNLDWGYLDHPPMVAWLIRLGDAAIPDFLRASSPQAWALIGLRLAPLFMAAVLLPLLIGACIEKVQGSPVTPLQYVTLMTAPALVFGPQIVTPDLPFFFFWTASLFCLLSFGSAALQPGRAVVLGLCLGLAALSKYAAVIAAFLVLVSGIGLRNALIAGLTSMLVFVPNVLWQLGPQGAVEYGGLFFQLRKGLGSGPINFRNVLDVWFVQLVFWSPAVLGGVFVSWARPGACRVPKTLVAWALAPLVFFSMTAIRRPAQANWPLIGVMAALVLVISASYARRRALVWITAINLVTITLAAVLVGRPSVLAPLTRPWSPRLADRLDKPTRLHEFEDWDVLHREIVAATRADPLPVKAQSHQLLSELLFFDAVAPPELRLGSRLKYWGEGSRKSQFNVLPEYYSSEADGRPYWLVEPGMPVANLPCPLRSMIYKGARSQRPFQLMLCQ